MKFHYIQGNCIRAQDKTDASRKFHNTTRLLSGIQLRTGDRQIHCADDKSKVKQQLLIVMGDSKKHKSDRGGWEQGGWKRGHCRGPFVRCSQTANNCADQCRTSHVKDSAADNQMSIFYVSKITRPVHYTAAGYDGRQGHRVVPQESEVSDGHGTDQTWLVCDHLRIECQWGCAAWQWMAISIGMLSCQSPALPKRSISSSSEKRHSPSAALQLQLRSWWDTD